MDPDNKELEDKIKREREEILEKVRKERAEILKRGGVLPEDEEINLQSKEEGRNQKVE
jgi:hypothetical protein